MHDPAVLKIKKMFQKDIRGKNTDLFILKNKNNVHAAISNYGARWVNMFVPGRHGKFINVIAGFNSIEPYTTPSACYYGATIGRYANRIANGKFTLLNKQYALNINNGSNHLHGGKKGFHNVVWDKIALRENSLLLNYLSPAGEEKYPGNLIVSVQYTLTDENEMKIEFTATADQPTIINLTNHAYFNLNGSGYIYDHLLAINADYYTPINETLIPSGDLTAVESTPFDFRKPLPIGRNINDNDQQLLYAGGYDHNFIINRKNHHLTIAATAEGDISKIKMDVLTTQPGIQLYTGNFMDGSNMLSNGNKDDYRTAFCLETQHFPDSPNEEKFPSTALMPGDTYQQTTVYRFYTDDKL